MSLSFIGPGGSFEQRWICYALLRDTVQHHLEGGTPSGRFRALHSIASALGRRIQVPAPELLQEVEAAATLLDRPVADLAISQRTGAILSLSWPIPEARQTQKLCEWEGRLELPYQDPKLLSDLFGTLVDGLRRITMPAKAGDVVQVVDT